MTRSMSLLMRIVFFMLLFQFTAPAFLVATSGFDREHDQVSSIDANKNSILFQLLIKENDEREYEELYERLELTTLLNFSDHTYAFLELHGFKTNHLFHSSEDNHQAKLFILFCAYLI